MVEGAIRSGGEAVWRGREEDRRGGRIDRRGGMMDDMNRSKESRCGYREGKINEGAMGRECL